MPHWQLLNYKPVRHKPIDNYYFYLNITMKALLYFLESQLDKYQNVEFYIDARSSPQRLMRDLRAPGECKKLVKYFSGATNNPMKLIRALSIANLLLLYGKDHFELVEENLKPRLSRDEWLNTKFLAPYHHFLMKVCTSKQQYLECGILSMRKGQAMQMLFYCINMLKLLFKVVQKMPFLGRYYKSKHNATICSAIEVIAVQAQRLYGGFKYSLSETLYRRDVYIREKGDEKIMKGILEDELTYINEEMKKLFLDKYFYPIGKGIAIKLFRPEEQTQECERAIKAIVSNHEDTERERKHLELQNTLFPGSGVVNWNFFEETLLAGPLNNTCPVNEPAFKELDDLAISEQDEEEEEQDPRKKEVGSGKQTNSGTVQQKGLGM